MKVRPLTPEQAKRTLANRLGPRVDRLRQVATKFGLRAYRCYLVWETFTGGGYGIGDRREVARHELLPTPRVRSLDSLSLNPMNAGIVPVGSVRLELVSATYTYDQLRGLMVPDRHEDHVPSPYDFYYELVEDGRGDPHPVRHRFRLLGVPGRREGKVSWSINLERTSGDNDRAGQPTYGQQADVAVPLEKSGEWMREMARLLPDVVNDGLYSAAIRMERDLKLDPALPFDRGHYKAGWKAERSEDGADIYNEEDHALYIEEGVRPYPNAMPGRAMVDALAEWAKRKGLGFVWKVKININKKGKLGGITRRQVPMDVRQLRSLGWAIAVSIRRRGVFNPPRGLQILAKLFRNRGRQYVDEEVRRELLKWWTQ